MLEKGLAGPGRRWEADSDADGHNYEASGIHSPPGRGWTVGLPGWIKKKSRTDFQYAFLKVTGRECVMESEQEANDITR